MNSADKEKNEYLHRKILIIIFVILFSISVILSVYLLGYRLGTIGVTPSLTKQLDVIKITSNSVDWKQSDKLKIFDNSSLKKGVIAPETNGIYKFIVQNESSENIKYNMSFIEENTENINMKFRLKIDNIYILGNEDNWVDISKMNLEDILITSNSKTMYTLEWYWKSTENDTNINEDGANYSLNINFTPYVER